MKFKIPMFFWLFLAIGLLISFGYFFIFERSLPLDRILSGSVVFQFDGRQVPLSADQEAKYVQWLKDNASGWTVDVNSHADSPKMIKGGNYKIIFLTDGSGVFQGNGLGFPDSNLHRRRLDIPKE